MNVAINKYFVGINWKCVWSVLKEVVMCGVWKELLKFKKKTKPEKFKIQKTILNQKDLI